jgi:hypothetical protein
MKKNPGAFIRQRLRSITIIRFLRKYQIHLLVLLQYNYVSLAGIEKPFTIKFKIDELMIP